MGVSRLEQWGPLRLSGILRQHNRVQAPEALAYGISAQWAEMVRKRGLVSVENCLGVFGRMADGETRFSYFCGASIAGSEGALCEGLHFLELPLMRCAVFPYYGHVRDLTDYVHYILRDGLREAGLSMMPDKVNTPEFCERYGAGFDPATLTGNIEVIVPVL